MKTVRYNIWDENEYHYEMAFSFQPNIVSYMHEDDLNSKKRPCMIVVPGGGYEAVCPSEGGIVAKTFFRRGYQAFVLTYTTNYLLNAPLHMQPLKDIARAVRFVRRNADQLHVNSEQIVICGSSAGGHLCGSLMVHYKDILDDAKEYSEISCRPDAGILCYPVISAKHDCWHEGSFQALYGRHPKEEEEEYMSLECQVSTDTPPCFLWHTATDQLVPVENSILFARACIGHKVPISFHIFTNGTHGLSIANEEWASGEHGDPYTLEQVFLLCEMALQGRITETEKTVEDMRGMIEDRAHISAKIIGNAIPNKEVAMWPDMADCWLHNLLSF